MSNEHVVSMKEHCLNVIEEVFEPAMDWLSDTVMSSEFQNDIKEFNCQESGPYLVPVTFCGVESPLKAIKFFFINVDESVIFAYTLDVCDHFQIKFDMFASSFNELGERLKSDETRSEMKKSLIAQLDEEEFAQLLNSPIRYRDTNKSVDFKELDDLICAKFRLRVEKLLGEGSIERYMVY